MLRNARQHRGTDVGIHHCTRSGAYLGLYAQHGRIGSHPNRLVALANVHSKAWHHVSIMDYARFNYVAQSLRSRCAAYAPRLGVYDFYAVEWAYRLFRDSKGYEDDAKQLRILG